MPPADPAEQLEAFIGRYTPEIAAQARAAIQAMTARLPGAVGLVYDNYNALAVGFGPSERASEAICSIAVYPRWVSLFFLQARGLPDPLGLLCGGGTQARHIVLKTPRTLAEPGVQALIHEALARAKAPLDPTRPSRLLIRSVSAKQRPRRPA